MIIYKANDDGLVTEICIMDERRTRMLEATTKPYNDIRHYPNNTIGIIRHSTYYTMYVPFDNRFHKIRNDGIVTVEDMKHFNNCHNVNERILICWI